MHSDGAWTICVREITAPASLESVWRDLQTRADASFFQSWAWIGTWLRTFPEQAHILALELKRNGRTIALSVLGRNTVTRNRVFAPRALLVSEAGDPEHDSLTVEHSGFLIERGQKAEAIARAIAYLERVDFNWDELHIGGVEAADAEVYLRSAQAAGLIPIVRSNYPYFYVDLAHLREHSLDYLSTLSANTRQQVRRSMRLYERHDGALMLQVAHSRAQALEFFAALRAVHQESWRKRGQPGAFVNERLVEFHRSLIEASFDHGEVQIVRVSAGGHDFGYLYNFLLDGVVSNYQTGFRYSDDGRLKPGLVSHVLAIEHSVAAGCRVYDFLTGDQRYKRSLAKNESTMQWLVLRRRGFNRNLGAGMRGIARWIVGR